MIHKIIKILLSILIIFHLYVEGIYSLFISQYINLTFFILILGTIYGYFGFYSKSKISIYIMNNILIFLILVPYGILLFLILVSINKFSDNLFMIIYLSFMVSIFPIGLLLINKNFKIIIYTYVLFSLYITLPFSFVLGMGGSPDDKIPFSMIIVFFSAFIIYPLAVLEYFLEIKPNSKKLGNSF